MDIKSYIELIKPERTLVNVMTAAAGFLFASRWGGPWIKLLYLLLGTGLIIASACVFNNLLDRKLDKKMKRTSKRVLAAASADTYSLSVIVYLIVLLILGLFLLSYANWLTFGLGVEAYVSYVFLYGWAKRHTIQGTLIGTLPGGSSLVAGYTAYTDRLDVTALLLFLIMLAWQMAHFFSIALYRFEDYKRAGLPVMPVKRGVEVTRRQILVYIGIFSLANLALLLTDKVGAIYALVMIAASIWWLEAGVGRASRTLSSSQWGKGLFLRSLKVITIFAVILPLGSILI
ncbi:MAG: heme o synthase [Candidatus Saccharimonadales bacterium]